jgi:hypothetical protein
MMHLFNNYEDWRSTITGVCLLDLNRAYCQARGRALMDESDPATWDFLKAYGSEYRDLVASWFERAGKEAAA